MNHLLGIRLFFLLVVEEYRLKESVRESVNFAVMESSHRRSSEILAPYISNPRSVPLRGQYFFDESIRTIDDVKPL